MQPEIKFRREEKSAKRPALEHMKRRIELGKKTNYSRKSKIYDMEEKQIFKCILDAHLHSVGLAMGI